MHAAAWSVAVIDHLPFGGTCALRGCDPKKVLIAGAEAVDLAGRMRRRGATGEVGISWRDLIAFKRTFTDPVPQKQEQRYAEQGIEAFHGMARFTARDRIEVDGQTLHARHVLIATGARPVPLTFPGAEHVITSDQFLELDELPARIVMVGGGYIAAEFSHIAARAGARVTVLQRAERMLTRFEPELVGWLMQKFSEIGIEVRTGTAVEAIERIGSGFGVHARAGSQEITAEADLVVHAAGRVPDLDALDLSAAGVAVENRRLVLNEFLQSVSNPAVYAAGDAAAKGPPLTPVSSHDGKVVAANLLNRQKASDWYTARRVAETVYGFKTLVEEGSGCILGAHLVGPHADEVINIFGFAIRHGLTAEDLKQTIFAYPTGASDVGYML